VGHCEPVGRAMGADPGAGRLCNPGPDPENNVLLWETWSKVGSSVASAEEPNLVEYPGLSPRSFTIVASKTACNLSVSLAKARHSFKILFSSSSSMIWYFEATSCLPYLQV
jgi:hypothetical protein